MPSATKFYAWVNPLKSLPSLEHTWVTTFDAPFACTAGLRKISGIAGEIAILLAPARPRRF